MTSPLANLYNPVNRTPTNKRGGPGQDWEFDTLTGQYRSTVTGEALTPDELRKAVERVITGAKIEARNATMRLEANEASIERWSLEMDAILVSLHTIAAAAGSAGLPALYDATDNLLRATIARERGYKALFVGNLYDTLRNGMQSLTTLLSFTLSRTVWANRAASYMDAALIAYEQHRLMLMVYLNYTEARRTVNRTAEHCIGCEREAGKGWGPIGELVLLGSEECEQWCKCSIEYRKTRPNLQLLDTTTNTTTEAFNGPVNTTSPI